MSMRRAFAALASVAALASSSIVNGVPAPPGTIISNTATSSHVVGVATANSTSNTVSLTVGALTSTATPTLTKFFGATNIAPGGTTTLVFRVTNSAGNPGQTGLGFVDTLPNSIRVTADAIPTFSTGCTATVSIAPTAVTVSSLAINAGTSVCDITVSAVTNAVGSTNADCTALPAAFTNTAGAISGLINITNAVTPQCLVVRDPGPVLTKAFAPSTILDGEVTSLVFILTNAAGNPGQAFLAFQDTLPAGLTFTSQSFGRLSPGCTGNVDVLLPRTVVYRDGTMTGGVSSCTLTISDVSNTPGQLNPTQCGPTNNATFTNDAASITGIANVQNGVTPQCMRVLASLPLLTKAFQDTRINDGDKTNLVFTITNVPTQPGWTALQFTDTLPSGLRLSAGASASVTGAGCSGTVNLVSGNQIRLTNLTMQPGTVSCRVVVDGVTNASGALNASCSANPGAFTNSADSITGLARLNNTVAPACLVIDPLDPALRMALTKSISATEGASPSGPYTVRLAYSNPVTTSVAAKRNVTIADPLPSGMRYVAGSLRFVSGANTIPLIATTGTFNAPAGSATYSTAPSQVSVVLSNVAPGESGEVVFDVTIDSALQAGSLLRNAGTLTFTNSANQTTGPRTTNTVEFRVLQSGGVTLRGATIASAEPGSEVTFENVLLNTGSRTDTFDVTMTGSTFPLGSVIRLFRPDGVTLLTDTNMNGVVDTGPVASGATYRIIVKLQLPAGAAGGPYRVTKNAQSVSNPLVRAADDDVLTVVTSLCRLTLVPDNAGQVRAGDSIVYSHVLANVGNCRETAVLPSDFLRGTTSGWTSQLFLDSPSNATSGATAGVLDPTDTQLVAGVTLSLAPGEQRTLFARISAPSNAAIGARDITTVVVNNTESQPLSSGSPATPGAAGVLTVRDTTTVGVTTTPTDVIRGYIDNGFQRPTVWGYIGRPLYFRADAPSCNALADVIERRTIIITGPNGEREEIIATETGPNTGVFTADQLPIRLPPVIAGDLILEGNPYDVFQIEILGCGRRISTTITLIDPNGVVFDSRTNQPVAGAIVRLFTASGGVCSNTPATVQSLVGGQIVSAPNTVTTGSDGRFDFPLVSAGEYCVRVQPPNGYTWTSTVPFTQLPPGRNILATGPTTGGSYGGAFRVGPETGPIIVDIPVDSGLASGLFIRKEALRTTVELGEFTDYSVLISNQTGYAMDRADVLATDNLPAGFTYVAGSVRLDGRAIADPQGGIGSRLVFNVGRMAVAQQVRLTYRVRVGPGAMQGDGINRIVASYRVGTVGLFAESNVATARVQVSGGVFTDRGYIVGAVYMDCNNDGLRTGSQAESKGRKAVSDIAPELGVPGVRLYLEDGTNVVTDLQGKFSFYGLTPRTHVLKIDRTSLPDGVMPSDFALLGNRNLGKGDSRVVDLKNGELHKANFAIITCESAIIAEVQARRRAAEGLRTELDGRLVERLVTDATSRAINDVKALPAAGTLGQTTTTTAGAVASTAIPTTAPVASTSGSMLLGASETDTTPAAVNRFDSLAKPLSIAPMKVGKTAAPIASVVPLEELLPELDATLAFLGLKDGDLMPSLQNTIRVKGVAGTTFVLKLNGKEVSPNQVGKRAVFDEKKTQAWEYVGVEFVAGDNTLVLTQVDGFGNARGEVTVKVRAPGELAKLALQFGERIVTLGGAIADGKTPVVMNVLMRDANGTPVTARTAVTVFASAGRLDVEDLNPSEPGAQIFVEGGSAEIRLLPPNEPASAVVNLSAGNIKSSTKLDFLPDLREMVAAGVIEGVLNLRRLDSSKLVPTRSQDSFEQEITHIARTWNDGKYQAGARAALFLKGKIKGEYLLTLAYDSDKATRERLFRDIQPDEFYPVYGDSSVRGFDAQSTGRFYLRVDHKKSYLLVGDFNTSQPNEARRLSNYNRSLTGVKQHIENANLSANIFASRDTTRQVVDEFAANGTSGPFQLTNASGLINSEKIDVLTRDRNQTAVILRVQPLIRFVDYEIESLTGRILLKAPIASLDENLNPQSLRIIYEVDQGGSAFWVAGADAQVKLSNRFEVGGVAVDDRNPVDRFRMLGVNAIAKIADKTFLIAEIARTNRDRTASDSSSEIGSTAGNAGRLELKHQGQSLEANLYATKAGAGFENQSASISRGRTEIGGKFSYRLDEKTRVRGELLHTEDNTTGGKRDGVLVAAERQLGNGLRIELGLRHDRDSQYVPPTSQGESNDATTSESSQKEVTTIRARLTSEFAKAKGASVYGEAEVDVQDSNRKAVAVGGEYMLPNNGRLYARHEFLSSITGPYGLTNQQRQNTTVVGLNTAYMKDGNLFSEYRVRDAISGGDAEAAIGLRNTWSVAEGLRVQAGFERVHAFSGQRQGESTAWTFGAEYTANPLWKGSTRLELRDGATSDSILSTVGLASKLSRDWSLLVRNTYSLTKNKGSSTGENEQDRFQLGFAYRDTQSDVWNALMRVEHRTENDTTQPEVTLKRTVELASLHANWQPRRPFTFATRYAVKWVNEDSNSVRSRNTTHLISGRAIWEVAPRWDASLNLSTLLSRDTKSKQIGAGVELGYMVMENLWLSGGYNWFGYRDEDLASGEYTNKGVYVRMRYKFDEDLFRAKANKSAARQSEAPTERAQEAALYEVKDTKEIKAEK